MSRYFWIIAITRPGPGWLSRALKSAALRVTVTVSPVNAAVARSCPSRSVRSVTSTILNRRRSGWLRIARIRNTMVRLLPDPWVCQMMPPRRSTWAVRRSGVALDQPSQCLVHAPVLLVAADDLDCSARADLHEQGEVPHDVEQTLRRQHPGREQFLLSKPLDRLLQWTRQPRRRWPGTGPSRSRSARAVPRTSPPRPVRRWWRR